MSSPSSTFRRAMPSVNAVPIIRPAAASAAPNDFQDPNEVKRRSAVRMYNKNYGLSQASLWVVMLLLFISAAAAGA